MLAIDTETTGLFIHKGCRAFTISAACHNHNTYLWKFPVDPFTREVTYTPDILQDFQDTLDSHEEIIFHNANYDIQALVAAGVTGIFDHDIHDTMVMSHAYKSDSHHGLKQLGVSLLSFPEDDEKRLSVITQAAARKAKALGWCIASKKDPHPSLRGLQKSWYKSDYWVPQQYAEYINIPKPSDWYTICDEYAEKDAIRTLGIYYIFQELMTTQQMQSYHKARQLIEPILRMQWEKITLIPEELAEAKKEYYEKTNVQLSTLRKIVHNPEFKPSSPKQLSEVLFTTYKYKPVKQGKSGPSTDKHTITTLIEKYPDNPGYPFLLELQKLRKVKTTNQYLDNYETHRNNKYELQPFFKQTGTGTNRLSCENPNTTNVGSASMDDDTSFKLRNIFGPSGNDIWTCIDYEQFQLLIFAVVSDSQALVDAYLSGMDMHQATAIRIFQTDNISKEQRRAAKNVNFGILFGAGPAKIEQTAGIPGLYNQFLQRLPGAKKYLTAQTQSVRSKGYVHTLGGYRLYVPRDRDYAASCYVIQGTEAEIVRAAMVDISNYTYGTPKQFYTSNPYINKDIVTQNCPYKMIMMVHDEIVLRSRITHHEHLQNIMSIMTNNALKLGVPARVDADIVVANWSDKYTYIGKPPCCNTGALVQWKHHDDTHEYTYQDCTNCNRSQIGLKY